MSNKGSFLAAGDTAASWLCNNDYLVSANGVFNAILQTDNNFVVYRGPGPGDSGLGEAGALWSTYGSKPYDNSPGQPCFIWLQPDGNFVLWVGTPPWQSSDSVLWSSYAESGYTSTPPTFISLDNDGCLRLYEGTSPTVTSGKCAWSSVATDPVESVSLGMPQYGDGTFSSNAPIQVFSTYYANGTNAEQQVIFTYDAQMTTVSSWELSAGMSIGVEATFEAGVPMIADGKIKTSLTVTVKGQYGQSTSTTVGKTVQFPVTVPAKTKVTGRFIISNVTITMPYTQVGNATLKSGASFPVSYVGTYTGVNDLACNCSTSKAPYSGETTYPQDNSVTVVKGTPAAAKA